MYVFFEYYCHSMNLLHLYRLSLLINSIPVCMNVITDGSRCIGDNIQKIHELI
jgi:hypothetical protein